MCTKLVHIFRKKCIQAPGVVQVLHVTFFGGVIQFHKFQLAEEFHHEEVPHVFVFSDVSPFLEDLFVTHSAWHGGLENII